MQFLSTLVSGTFIKRYKRFFVDVALDDGIVVTAHCPNTGSMQGVLTEGNRVYLSVNNDPKRKLKYTWEYVELDGVPVGVNTQNPNKIIKEALLNGAIEPLREYSNVQPEVKYGSQNSRIDFLLTHPDGSKCYVEVKNAHHFAIEQGLKVGIFPDSVTTRGVKHLQELMDVVKEGQRAVVIYCLQRGDCEAFRFGYEYDPNYAQTAQDAMAVGVEMLPYTCNISLTDIVLNKQLKLLNT